MTNLEQIEKLARLGMQQAGIAKFFGLSVNMFKTDEEVKDAYNRGLEARRKTISGQVEYLAELGFNQEQVAGSIGLDRTVVSRDRYHEEFKRGHFVMKTRLRSELFNVAMSENITNAKERMLEFLAKNQLGMSDRVAHVKEYDYNKIYADLRKVAENNPTVIDDFLEHIQSGGDPEAFLSNGAMTKAEA